MNSGQYFWLTYMETTKKAQGTVPFLYDEYKLFLTYQP